MTLHEPLSPVYSGRFRLLYEERPGGPGSKAHGPSLSLCFWVSGPGALGPAFGQWAPQGLPTALSQEPENRGRPPSLWGDLRPPALFPRLQAQLIFSTASAERSRQREAWAGPGWLPISPAHRQPEAQAKHLCLGISTPSRGPRQSAGPAARPPSRNDSHQALPTSVCPFLPMTTS